MNERTQIWNCGGGTQSTAIAALIIAGRLPKPDLAVIADTERERSTTWEYLDRWTTPALAEIGLTIHRVPKSKYATVDLWGGKDGVTLLIPAFTDKTSEIGKLPAYCSTEWKTRVVRRWATEEHAITAATNWIGFSTDEDRRAKHLGSGKWMRRFPLIELGISRTECYSIVDRMGWPQPPHSSCWMCPNHNDQEWVEVREGGEMPKTEAFEADIQRRDPHAWLHRTCDPIGSVEFAPRQSTLFGGCESGMCFT